MSEERLTETGENVERILIKCRAAGTPTKRQHWQAVIACLLPCTDEALAEFARQGRLLGVGWIVPIAEALLEELHSGRAIRDEKSGAIVVKDFRSNRAFDVLN